MTTRLMQLFKLSRLYQTLSVKLNMERIVMLRNTRQPYSSRHWQKRCVFTVACILGVPSAMYLKNYTFVNDNRQSGFTPVLCASGPKFNRKNFNPVADLVEQTAGAVVHIESTAYQGRFFRSFGYVVSSSYFMLLSFVRTKP